MKTLTWTCLNAVLALVVAMVLAGCAGPRTDLDRGEDPCAVYETAEEILAMPAGKARVEQSGPCYVYLMNKQGRGFYLGGPGAGAEVWSFLDVLKEGRAYRFPEVFREYRRVKASKALPASGETRSVGFGTKR